IEALEARTVPAQLGQVITLPELTGLGEEVARTAPADPGGHTSMKVDPGSIVTLKIDPSGPAGLKIDTHLKIDTNLKSDPSGPAGLKIDTSFFHNGEEQA